MKLVKLMDAGESGTKLGKFLEALMRPFKPEPFMMEVGRLEHNLAIYWRDGWSEDRREKLRTHFTALLELEKAHGFRVTANHTAKVLQVLETFADKDKTWVTEAVRMTRRTLHEEMECFSYFEIADHELPYWENLEPFGNGVATHFPSAAEDIEEASKCIALSRWTASAFHSLRVQEIAINSVYKVMTGGGMPKECERSWGKVLTKISNELDSHEKSNKPDWIRWTPPMRSAYAFLNNAKSLWRDDTMHVGPKKDDKEALRIFDSTRIVMQHLAEWINEEGNFHEGK